MEFENYTDEIFELEAEFNTEEEEAEEPKKSKAKAIVAIFIICALIIGSISGYFFMYARPLPHAIFV